MGIYIDQRGYLTDRKKIAVTTNSGHFKLLNKAEKKVVFEGDAIDAGFDECSGEQVYHFDFTSYEEPGDYIIMGENGENSVAFRLDYELFDSIKNDMLRAFYFQRCGCKLLMEYAGPYVHEACHTAPSILLEDYLNHTENPKQFDLTGGWHDAGDYGRYSSAGAVALGHLLYAYDLFPEAFFEKIYIPESNNPFADIINECFYELKWLLKMQAPDGGVYHKLTSFVHADFIMPEEDKSQFIIFPVSSMATADFAAVMALAARLYEPLPLPLYTDFAKEALAAAKRAWKWLSENPYVGFHNPDGCNTGEYDDDCDLDERMWACAELLRSDSENASEYLEKLKEYAFSDICKTGMGWTDVSGFALMSVLFDSEHRAGAAVEEVFRNALFTEVNRLMPMLKKSGYLLAMQPEDFVWGSNMVVCNRAILFILASLLSEQDSREYQDAALEHFHYMLGKNAMNTSYVTGYGDLSFKNPHNRPTVADGLDLPMPGWVSGGPFKTPCDPKAVEMIPAGTAPMKCYIDDIDSYSTNEITIYWNSPMVFMASCFSLLEW